MLQCFGSGLLRVSLNDSLGRAPDVLNSRPEKTAFARAECAVIALPCVRKRAKLIFSPRIYRSLCFPLLRKWSAKVYLARCGSEPCVRKWSKVSASKAELGVVDTGEADVLPLALDVAIVA